MSAKRKTSEVWNFFTITDASKMLAKCDLCHQTFSYKSSVSNLKKHIQKKHITVSLNIENDGLSKRPRLTSDTETNTPSTTSPQVKQ